jgi:hypothetical protein
LRENAMWSPDAKWVECDLHSFHVSDAQPATTLARNPNPIRTPRRIILLRE